MAQEALEKQQKPALKKGLSMLEEPFSKAPQEPAQEFKDTIKHQLDILESKQTCSSTAEFVKSKFQEDTRI